MVPETKISARNVNFYYGRTKALKDITLDIHEKQVTAFIGPSGCGKSTFIRLLNRMNDLIPGSHVEGTITMDGLDVNHPKTDVVKTMIADSITSFVNEDADLARMVCERDNVVDDLRTQIIRELITFMVADPTTIERALQIMKIASNLERIADLATNICEDVIYMVKGTVIKHHKDEKKSP